jgi:hypothetical protein
MSKGIWHVKIIDQE